MSDELKNPFNAANTYRQTTSIEDDAQSSSQSDTSPASHDEVNNNKKTAIEGIKMSFKDGLIKKDNGLKYLIISLVVIIMDQITKYICVYNIPYRTMGIEVLPFFNLIHVYNHGAAFSMFDDWGGGQRYFFAAIAIIMSAFFVYQLARTSSKHKWLCLSFVLFVGGAIGNLVDRIIHGYVIDFLLFYLKDDTGRIIWAFPAFNVADIAVCVGAFLLALVSFFPKKENTKENKDAANESSQDAQKMS